MLAIIAPAIGSRRADMQQTPGVDRICQALDRSAENLWQSRLHAWRGEAAMMFTTLRRLDWEASSGLIGPPLDWLGEPLKSCKALLRPVVWRLNRERSLLSASEVESLVRLATNDHDLIAKGQALAGPVPVLPDFANWVGADPFPLTTTHELINGSLVKGRLALAVLSADLRQQPLPLDPFANPPAPLQPIERNGRTIGWYSVGPNGLDDGGVSNGDFGMPISESLGKRGFADPHEPRTP